MDLRPVLLLAALLLMLAGMVYTVFGADCRCCDEDAPTCAVVWPPVMI